MLNFIVVQTSHEQKTSCMQKSKKQKKIVWIWFGRAVYMDQSGQLRFSLTRNVFLLANIKILKTPM